MEYHLELADAAEFNRLISCRHSSSGQGDIVNALQRDPLAKAEFWGAIKGKRVDHVYLTRIDGTDFVSWTGRFADGYHRYLGRPMRIKETAHEA